MNNSKLIELYKTLTKIEKRRFAQYVESPFFNTNTGVVMLNRYIQTATEEKTTSKNPDNMHVFALDKKEIFRKLFGAEKFDDQKLKNVMTILMNHLETFIAQLKFEKNEFLLKGFLLMGLRERSLDKHFISNAGDYKKKLGEKKMYDSDYFYEQYLLEKELDHYFIKKEVRKSNESLQRKSDSLDTFYLSEKLKNLCDMVNRKNIISATYTISLMDELLTYINKNLNSIRDIPSIYIYYKILLGLIESDVPQHFYELKTALEKYGKMFSKEESRQMYDYAENYCIKKVNSGDPAYLPELFSIYELLLSNEILFEGEHLSQLDYKNIVSIALKLDKFEWTIDFIEKYKSRIAPKFRENAYQYNLASYYFSKQDYKNALKLLQRVEFIDAYYHLGAKSMLLRMYFELQEVEPFYSLIDAYKVYLARNKSISFYQRQVHQKFVKYSKRAFDLKLKSISLSHTALQLAIKQLKDRVNIEKNDTNLSWLMKRVETIFADGV